MFQIGEVVAYGATGICKVEAVKVMSLSRTGADRQEYYILRPVATPTCTTYVPTANEALIGKMRRVYTAQEIDAIILSSKGEPLAWIEDTRRRTEVFGQIVAKGISPELMKLIARLYTEKRSRIEAGKRPCGTDEKILASAERIIKEEFSYVLQISPQDVSAYITERSK